MDYTASNSMSISNDELKRKRSWRISRYWLRW